MLFYSGRDNMIIAAKDSSTNSSWLEQESKQ